jgi:hypothetical protein
LKPLLRVVGILGRRRGRCLRNERNAYLLRAQSCINRAGYCDLD